MASRAQKPSKDEAPAYLRITAVEHAALMKGTLALIQDVTEMLFRAANRDKDSDEMNAGEVEDCVFKLDTLTNIMIASNDDMLTVLQDIGEKVPFSSGSLVIRKGM